MHAWESIQLTVDYIEEHYDEELTVGNLAKISHLSPFYYQRLFRRLVKKTVAEYIKLRRLAKSAVLLKDSQLIITVAIACGFNSQATFAKAFKEIYGITPSEYRNGEYQLDFFIKPELVLSYTLIDEGVPLITEGIVLEIERQELKQETLYVGRSTQGLVAELNQPKVNTLASLWTNLAAEFVTRDVITGDGIDVLRSSSDPTIFNYFVGFEARQSISGFEDFIMPKGEYVVCAYEAADFDSLINEALYKASQYLYEVWLPNYQIEPDALLVQRYSNPKEDYCGIELWAKVKSGT